MTPQVDDVAEARDRPAATKPVAVTPPARATVAAPPARARLRFTFARERARRLLAYASRRFDLGLAGLQLATIALACLAGVAALVLYRHQTIACFTPAWTFLASVRLAFPPLVAFAGSYVLALLAGISPVDASKATLSFLKNRFFQEPLWMAAAAAISFVFSAGVFFYTSRTPPPEYAAFVAHLMGGESDGHHAARRILASIDDRDPVLARRLGWVVDVFEERRRLTEGGATPRALRARLLVRALDSNVTDPSWESHPLRHHGVAEAYSLWAQIATNMGNAVGSEHDSPAELRRAALRHYAAVAADESRWTTDLLRSSAAHNEANVYLYAGDYETALALAEQVNGRWPNLSTWGNIVALHVLVAVLDDSRFRDAPRRDHVQAAIREGRRAYEWARTSGKALTDLSSYASVAANLGTAYLVAGRFRESLPHLEEVLEIMDDASAHHSLATALRLAGETERAERVLRHGEVPPATAADVARARVDRNVRGECAYFAWWLVFEGTNAAAAEMQLRAYFGAPAPGGPDAGADLAALKARMLDAIRRQPDVCAYVGAIPAVRQALGEVPTGR